MHLVRNRKNKSFNTQEGQKQNSRKNQTLIKYHKRSVVCRLTQKLEPLQHNKQYHGKALLSSFNMNGHTLGFYPQTKKLEPPCIA